MMIDIYDYAIADYYRSLGIIGFLIYVANYTCLSLRILSSESARYFVINTCAASFVFLSLMQDFNLASALIQGFWIIIGTVAILLRIHRHFRDKRQRQIPLHLHPAARVMPANQAMPTDHGRPDVLKVQVHAA